MTYLEVCDKLRKIHYAIQAATELSMDDSVHGMDKTAIREECIELHRAAHDTMREFEAECVKRGREQAIERIDKALIYDQNERMSITKARLSEIVR